MRPLLTGAARPLRTAVGAAPAVALALVAALAPGDAGGAEAGAASPFAWQAEYLLDALQVRRPRSGAVLGHLELGLTADAERWLGWSGTTLHVSAIADHGAKPNRTLGSLQGISNIEVDPAAARLYATWAERELAAGVTARVGLLGLDEEFYATPASAPFIHPAFGTGPELAETGANGPSIFPVLSLGVRLKAELDGGAYLQTALLDAVPGHANHPRRTTVRLSRGEGALLVAEAGWQERSAEGPGEARWGIGVWGYSRRVEPVDAGTARANAGVYAIGQALLLDRREGRTRAFVRAGVAERRVNAIDAAFDLGLVVDRPLGEAGPEAVFAGVAVAHLGRPWRAAQARAGVALVAQETAVELGAVFQLGRGFALQPLVQRIRNVGGERRTATIAGLRLAWSFASDAKPD